MILAAILVLGGIQVILTGFLMKTYSVIHGYENKKGIIEVVMKYSNLEKFLVVGFFLSFTGILIGLNILIRWVSTEFRFSLGDLNSNYLSCTDCKRAPDLSLCRIPEHDAPQ